MRPETRNRLINTGIQHWLNTGSSHKLYKLLPTMDNLWERYAKEEGDFRTGNEVYGYEDDSSVCANMEYISDRWKCACRLKWIIDGLRLGYI